MHRLGCWSSRPAQSLAASRIHASHRCVDTRTPVVERRQPLCLTFGKPGHAEFLQKGCIVRCASILGQLCAQLFELPLHTRLDFVDVIPGRKLSCRSGSSLLKSTITRGKRSFASSTITSISCIEAHSVHGEELRRRIPPLRTKSLASLALELHVLQMGSKFLGSTPYSGYMSFARRWSYGPRHCSLSFSSART